MKSESDWPFIVLSHNKRCHHDHAHFNIFTYLFIVTFDQLEEEPDSSPTTYRKVYNPEPL